MPTPNLIDNSCFLFKCISLVNEDKNSKQNFLFTFKIRDVITSNEIIEWYFILIQKFSLCEELNEIYGSNNKGHVHKPIEYADKLELIESIYRKAGYEEEWILENISDSAIYQIILTDSRTKQDPVYECRLFFTKSQIVWEDVEENVQTEGYVYRPLFIDVNHLIYYMEGFPQDFNKCLICGKDSCC